MNLILYYDYKWRISLLRCNLKFNSFFFLFFSIICGYIFRRENKILYYTFTVWHKLNTWKYWIKKKFLFDFRTGNFFFFFSFFSFPSLLCIIYNIFLHIRISTATYTLCKSRKRMNNFFAVLLSRYKWKMRDFPT